LLSPIRAAEAHPWTDQSLACGLDVVQTPAPGEIWLSQTTTRSRRVGNREVNTLFAFTAAEDKCY